MSKIVLTVLWFYAILLFSCADNYLPEFPKFVGESSSSSVATYTVTYNAGTTVTDVAVPLNQIKIYDVALTLSGAVPTRTGYTFAGWNTSANGTGVPYVPGAKYTENAGTTLYAQWTANTYTVAYYANGGTGAPANQIKTHDVPLTLSTDVPTRTGYAFANWDTLDQNTSNWENWSWDYWNLNHDSGTVYAPGASYATNADITLYALWKRTYNITYNANNGTDAPSNQTKILGIALTLSSAEPTRTGYVFANWNTSANGSGTSYAPGASYTNNYDITLYAQWNNPVVSNCDGQVFKKVTIGNQTWMAENLNCNVSGSKCYKNNEYYCDAYGRLYDWATAMALPSSCNSSFCASSINSNHQGICPDGWHLPSDAEWKELIDYAGGYSSKLKATSGWWNNRNGTDNYGFSALPGGDGSSDGSFYGVGDYGYWWSASERSSYSAYDWHMYYYYEDAIYGNCYKGDLLSVRCLQD